MKDSLSTFFSRVDPEPILRAFLAEYRGGRRRRVRQLFTNDIHFEVFKHLPKRSAKVYVSKSYVVLEFHFKVRDRWAREDFTIHESYYVIGVNTDGKLFINKLERRPAAEGLADTLVGWGRDVVEFHATGDDSVAWVMGFNADLERGPIKAIPPPAAEERTMWLIRIQGDLVMNVDICDDISATYLRVLKGELGGHVAAALREVLLERIMLTLASRGITSERVRNRLIVEAVPRYKPHEYEDTVAQKILSLLERELYYQDLGLRLKLTKPSYYVDPVDNDTIKVQVSSDRGRYGSPYRPIAIEAEPSVAAVGRAVEQIMRGLHVEVGRRVVYHGRHKVTFQGYPSRLTISARLPINNLDGLEDTRVFNIGLGAYYIAPGPLEVTHAEHGTHRYQVTKGLVATFQGVRVAPDFDNRLSHYALKAL
jgi:hypothetical protein